MCHKLCMITCALALLYDYNVLNLLRLYVKMALISHWNYFCLIHLRKCASWRKATNKCQKFIKKFFWKRPLFETWEYACKTFCRSRFCDHTSSLIDIYIMNLRTSFVMQKRSYSRFLIWLHLKFISTHLGYAADDTIILMMASFKKKYFCCLSW